MYHINFETEKNTLHRSKITSSALYLTTSRLSEHIILCLNKVRHLHEINVNTIFQTNTVTCHTRLCSRYHLIIVLDKSVLEIRETIPVSLRPTTDKYLIPVLFFFYELPVSLKLGRTVFYR